MSNQRTVTVGPEGVSFGKGCWISHEKITGYTATQLNQRLCGIVGREYMKWVIGILSPEEYEAKRSDLLQRISIAQLSGGNIACESNEAKRLEEELKELEASRDSQG